MATTWHWHTIGTTSILFEEQTGYVLPETHPIAQVTKRQVYESEKPMWYAFVGIEPGSRDVRMIGRFDDLETAQRAVENGNY
jgi:hypothetical protein